MERLDNLYFSAKTKLCSIKQKFITDESGVSNIVAAVIMILVAIGLAAVLFPKLSDLVTNSVPDKLEGY